MCVCVCVCECVCVWSRLEVRGGLYCFFQVIKLAGQLVSLVKLTAFFIPEAVGSEGNMSLTFASLPLLK